MPIDTGDASALYGGVVLTHTTSNGRVKHGVHKNPYLTRKAEKRKRDITRGRKRDERLPEFTATSDWVILETNLEERANNAQSSFFGRLMQFVRFR